MDQSSEHSGGGRWLWTVAIVGSVLATVTWVAASKWQGQTEAAASVVLGFAVVAVTWRYTRHTAEMVEEMRVQRSAEDERRKQELRSVRLNLVAELTALKGYIDHDLRPNVDGTGTGPPYPQLQLLALDAYVANMATMTPECNIAVLRVHYQLAAANTRADERSADAYWKRADSLCDHLIYEAVQALRSEN